MRNKKTPSSYSALPNMTKVPKDSYYTCARQCMCGFIFMMWIKLVYFLYGAIEYGNYCLPNDELIVWVSK